METNSMWGSSHTFVAGIAWLTLVAAQSTSPTISACTQAELQSIIGALGSGNAPGSTTPPVVAGQKCLDCILPCFRSATATNAQATCLTTCGSVATQPAAVAPQTAISAPAPPPAFVAPPSLPSPAPMSPTPPTSPLGGVSGGQSPPTPTLGSSPLPPTPMPKVSIDPLCEDNYVDACVGFAQQGLCQTSVAFMAINCRRSCVFCAPSNSNATAPPTLADCIDLDSECASYARSGLCASNPAFMNVNCRRSCGTCPSGTRAPTPVDCGSTAALDCAPCSVCLRCFGMTNKADCASCVVCEPCSFYARCYTTAPAPARLPTATPTTQPSVAPSPDSCADLDASCSVLAQSGMCGSRTTFMSVNCRKSCGMCGRSGAPTSQTPSPTQSQRGPRLAAVAVFTAAINDGVEGTIQFSQVAPPSSPTEISINLVGTMGSDRNFGEYHIHEYPVDWANANGPCSVQSVGGHYDPTHAASFGTAGCSISTPTACELGDLSGKFGVLGGSAVSLRFTDYDLPLSGVNRAGGIPYSRRFGLSGRMYRVYAAGVCRSGCHRSFVPLLGWGRAQRVSSGSRSSSTTALGNGGYVRPSSGTTGARMRRILPQLASTCFLTVQQGHGHRCVPSPRPASSVDARAACAEALPHRRPQRLRPLPPSVRASVWTGSHPRSAPAGLEWANASPIRSTWEPIVRGAAGCARRW